MKKILFLIVCVFAAIGANAQDVIVKKDGTTIQAKVQKVTSTEVEYKKFSNQPGPTYSIGISELLSINYENGEKDTFGTANPDIVTKETATQYSNDRELLNIYNNLSHDPHNKKKAKAWKTVELLGAGVVVIGGGIILATGGKDGDLNQYCAIGMGAGLIAGVTGLIISKRYNNTINQQIHSSAILENRFQLDNGKSLALGVDAIRDNINNSQTLGLGVRLNF